MQNNSYLAHEAYMYYPVAIASSFFSKPLFSRSKLLYTLQILLRLPEWNGSFPIHSFSPYLFLSSLSMAIQGLDSHASISLISHILSQTISEYPATKTPTTSKYVWRNHPYLILMHINAELAKGADSSILKRNSHKSQSKIFTSKLNNILNRIIKRKIIHESRFHSTSHEDKRQLPPISSPSFSHSPRSHQSLLSPTHNVHESASSFFPSYGQYCQSLSPDPQQMVYGYSSAPKSPKSTSSPSAYSSFDSDDDSIEIPSHKWRP
ncbi:hypothetical protein ADUPG1_010561, partial [Aduncisulcus paluster]